MEDDFERISWRQILSRFVGFCGFFAKTKKDANKVVSVFFGSTTIDRMFDLPTDTDLVLAKCRLTF